MTGNEHERRRPGLWHGIGMQLRHPAGFGGSLMGRLMIFMNARPYSLAIEALAVQPEDTVLELGCGPGFGIARLARLAKRGEVIGIDVSDVMLRQARRRNRKAIGRGRVRLISGCFTRLPLCNENCDRILAVNVAYFFHPDGHEVREAWRVLKPGGRMVLYVTDRASMRRWPFASPESHLLHDADSLFLLLRNGGVPPESIAIRELSLPLGIRGLVAIINK